MFSWTCLWMAIPDTASPRNYFLGKKLHISAAKLHFTHIKPCRYQQQQTGPYSDKNLPTTGGSRYQFILQLILTEMELPFSKQGARNTFYQMKAHVEEVQYVLLCNTSLLWWQSALKDWALVRSDLWLSPMCGTHCYLLFYHKLPSSSARAEMASLRIFASFKNALSGY